MTTPAIIVPARSTGAPIAFREDIYGSFISDLQRHFAAPASRQQESTEDKFKRLREAWRAATILDSSTSQKLSHRAYLAIIAMGRPVVPLILRELAQRPGHWGPALSAITGARPYARETEGDLRAVARAWLQWGRGQRLVA
jgi:hypothetical protein